MPGRRAFSLDVLLLLIALIAFVGAENAAVAQSQFPPTFVPSGGQLYRQFCAACHGADAKGRGPAADSLKVAPPDLTTLAVRHGGKFPYDYVSDILLFGPGLSAHGSATMPTWGSIFFFMDKRNEAAARQRIKNLSNYLESPQIGRKQSGPGPL